ncbi:MAG TPA: M48 family metalloprotease [Myxococcota bacterium]|nr:M48 family metalloprotease [Myxococcota bacterium]
MTEQKFEALVSRLERYAREHPSAYRLRTLMLALLGYAYVLLVGIGALALAGLLVAAVVASGSKATIWILKLGKLGLGLVALVLAVARALWVRLEAPTGIRIERSAYPDLFAHIDRIRTRTGAPRAHVVLLTDDFNAAVTQIPRLGVFGWQKNYLLLGLPLLRALSLEQFDAVLAHEFGHLSGSHGRLGGWIYRARTTWARIHETLEREKHWASFVFLPFMRWYAPYFAAYSFVQARAQEYEADRAGAKASSPRAMADALVGLEVRGHELGDYWNRVRGRADEQPEPVRPYAEMRFGPSDEARATATIERALREQTTVANTHPCLRERLAALAQEARTPPQPEKSAAEALLGERLPDVAGELDRQWQQHVMENWRERHHRATEARGRLSELASRPELTPDESWERARLCEEFEGPESGRARYQEIVARDERHAGAWFALGRMQLAEDDGAGLDHLARALALDDDAILPATEMAVAFLRRAGREDEAQRWIERAQPRVQKLEAARRERAEIRMDGRYELAGIDGEARGRLVDALRAHPRVKQAWLVRRQLEHFPESPLFVLGVKRAWSPWDFVSRDGRRQRDLELQQQLTEVPIPGEAFIIVVNHRPRKQRRLFLDVAGSSIFERRAARG